MKNGEKTPIPCTATGMGTGPVDAAYKAIDALVRVQARFFPLKPLIIDP